MTAFEINVTTPARDSETGELVPGVRVDDVMIVERDTLTQAKAAALAAFGEGAKIVGKPVELETQTPPETLEEAEG